MGFTTAAVLGLLAVGCGGANTSDTSPVSTSSDGLQSARPVSVSDAADALKASRCMRAHGVPNFPDPVAGGHFGFTVGNGIDPNSPSFKTAFAFCGRRYLHLHSPSPAEQAQRNAAAVKYSQCMRSHGAADFPDPANGQGIIRIPADSYLDTPRVQTAEAACAALRTGVLFSLPVPIH